MTLHSENQFLPELPSSLRAIACGLLQILPGSCGVFWRCRRFKSFTGASLALARTSCSRCTGELLVLALRSPWRMGAKPVQLMHR